MFFILLNLKTNVHNIIIFFDKRKNVNEYKIHVYSLTLIVTFINKNFLKIKYFI